MLHNISSTSFPENEDSELMNQDVFQHFIQNMPKQKKNEQTCNLKSENMKRKRLWKCEKFGKNPKIQKLST